MLKLQLYLNHLSNNFYLKKTNKQKTPQQNKENTKTPANRIEEIQLTLHKANYLDYNALAWEMVSPWKP